MLGSNFACFLDHAEYSLLQTKQKCLEAKIPKIYREIPSTIMYDVLGSAYNKASYDLTMFGYSSKKCCEKNDFLLH
jgi:hypothetical protein